MVKPNITDWISAVGTLLTLPTATWGIISLFKRDKKREEEVNALKEIAKSQNEVVKQLEYQTEALQESNKLMEDQMEFQRQTLSYDKVQKEELLHFEKQKHKLEIKPYFKSHGASSSIFGIELRLMNYGKQAFVNKIDVIIAENISFDQSDSEIEVGEKHDYQIKGSRNNSQRPYPPFYYELKFIYKDIEENKYYQIIKGKDLQYTIDKPIEINDKS